MEQIVDETSAIVREVWKLRFHELQVIEIEFVELMTIASVRRNLMDFDITSTVEMKIYDGYNIRNGEG